VVVIARCPVPGHMIMLVARGYAPTLSGEA
jgi:hypothetical protein